VRLTPHCLPAVDAAALVVICSGAAVAAATTCHNQRSAGGAAAALQQLRGPWVVRAYWLMTTAVDVAVLRYAGLLAVSL
jgi:hypothetical protein